MRIIELQAENVKRIRAVDIRPEGSTVIISGRNGQGKTSVLDSIWFALGGGPATKGTPKPVREGEDHASVRLDLGDLIVTRTWSGDEKSKLTVESPDGARFRSPQAMLDDLVGRLSFDPLGFSSLPDREQRATLLDLIELPFDPEALEVERAAIYDGRREINREADTIAAQLARMPEPDEDLPILEFSSGQILVEYREAQDKIRQNEAVRTAESEAGLELRRLRVREEERKELYHAASKATKEAKDRATAATEAVKSLGPDPSLDGFEERLSALEETNAAIRAGRERKLVAGRLSLSRSSSDSMTEKLDEIDRKKREAIEAAEMPVEGLSFDESGVLYQGVPFKQASSAEQLRVSLAMAMSLNPSIRVIRIMDGSLLDSTNMALIEEMATENDYQVWIERVDETGTAGIVIEDGAVLTTEVGA